jgi:hypothetical protein
LIFKTKGKHNNQVMVEINKSQKTARNPNQLLTTRALRCPLSKEKGRENGDKAQIDTRMYTWCEKLFLRSQSTLGSLCSV